MGCEQNSKTVATDKKLIGLIEQANKAVNGGKQIDYVSLLQDLLKQVKDPQAGLDNPYVIVCQLLAQIAQTGANVDVVQEKPVGK